MGKMCELVLQCNQEKVHKQVALVVPPFIQFLRLDQAEGQEEPLLGGVEGQLCTTLTKFATSFRSHCNQMGRALVRTG